MCGHHSQEAKALAKASSNVSILLPQKVLAKAQSSSVRTPLTPKVKAKISSTLFVAKALAKATSSTHLKAKAKAKRDEYDHSPLSSIGPEREMIVHG